MKTKLTYLLTVFLLTGTMGCRQPVKPLYSPDKNLQINVAEKGGSLYYSLTAHKQLLIDTSLIGLKSQKNKKFTVTQRSVNSVWKPVWGKRTEAADVYEELTCDYGDSKIIFRVYNDGLAFKYDFSSPEEIELTEFNFAGDYTAWYYNGENHNLGPEKLSACEGKRRPVMTIKADDSHYLAVHEADLTSGEPLILQGKKSKKFTVASKLTSAWRVVFFGTAPGTMVDSHLLELLNPDPAQGSDFSWVHPGVAVWDWRINGAEVKGFKYTMSLPSWKRMVDFAAQNQFLYLVLDADWYGPEFGKDSDPTTGGKARDVREIIRYGKEKGVGLWLYLNDVGGRNYPLEQVLKQYHDWGAVGIKYGFMSGSFEEKNTRTRMITDLCAKYRLMCDYHDNPVHPYGQMRTYPNALTREFCHAQLDGHHVFEPKTFVTSVFVNMLAGPLDMNNGLADLRQKGRVDYGVPVPSTPAGEAARTLITFSGATIIPDIPESYNKYPEMLTFINHEQMPWQESKTLSGEIGEYIVMARQNKAGDWLVGAATNESAREVNIPLSFLDKQKYDAMILQDGEKADYQNHLESYTTLKKTVTDQDVIKVKLGSGGGACVLLKARRGE